MNWFRTLQVYRLPAPWPVLASQLEDKLQPFSFQPGGTLEGQTKGWISPRENDLLVHAINGQMLLTMRTEKKLLPASVINQVTKAKAEEVAEQQGFKPGRKQMREIKEAVTDELRPKAFSVFRDTRVWIDTANGWLVIDASSAAVCDEVVELLHKCIDPLPLALFHVNQSPSAAMTGWMVADEAPAGFSIDQDTELRATGDSKASVRYVKHSIEVEEVRRHIEAGKQCTRLAMTWADRVSFVLTESLAIKRVNALDVLKEQADTAGTGDDERFDADFVLMTGELAKLIAAVADALGGEPAATPDADGIDRGHDGRALYDLAVDLVRQEDRASISLVQRHLKIGYNAAARLLEQMEVAGIITPMNASGHREVRAA